MFFNKRYGKFYLYCPVHKKDGGMAIAVGISDKPEGPFKDLGYPLVDEGDWNDIDPTVYIDDDGSIDKVEKCDGVDAIY